MRQCILLVALFVLLPASDLTAVEGNDTAHVMLFGGTGRLGSDIAKSLVQAGHDVTVFARASSDRKRLRNLDVSFVVGDVLDANSVDAAIAAKEVDVVIDALGRGSAGVDFYITSAQNIATLAARYHVKQLILNGSVGAGDSAAHPDYASLSAGLRRLMDAKTQGEEAVVGSGVNYTIIRNSHLVAYGVAESGNAKLYEDRSIAGSVTRQGLARLITGCILNESCYNKIYHAADLTYKRRNHGEE